MGPTTKPASLETVETVELAHATSSHPCSRSPRREEKTAHRLRLTSVAFSLLVAGVSDGSVGALLPHVLREYSVDTAIVSCIYGASFFAWLLAAVSSTHLCQRLDSGALLALGALCQIPAQALLVWGPPLPLFAVATWLASLGQAFQNTHGNAFAASTKGAPHRWLALIHAAHMTGCLLGPFVATSVASAGAVSRWYLFYAFPLGLSVANLALVLVAFRDSLRLRPSGKRLDRDGEPRGLESSPPSLVKATLSLPGVWLLSNFFFFHVGSVVTIGGWVVEYLVDVRGGDLSQMGYMPVGFNGGALLGRLLLAEPTFRFGERNMILAYCLAAIALQLVFWLVPNLIAASVCVCLLGFFTGPLVATSISLGSKLFPPHLRSTGLGFVFVFASMGGSLFPIITGVIASRGSVSVLQPILTGLFSATAISWFLVPPPKGKSLLDEGVLDSD